MTVPTRVEAEAIIAGRITADPAFRDTLLGHPHDLVAGGVRWSDKGFASRRASCFGEWDGS